MLYPPILETLLEELLRKIQDGSACQSVAIRLLEDGDFPYYAQMGFSDFFIQKEKTLNARNEKGQLILESDGTPFVECMCGNVVRNKFNPKRSYFTKTGAFWTNSTTQLLKSFTEAEKQEVGKTRNTCHNYGYESVALIPIHSKNKTIGLVQINDPRENMFTLGSIGRFQLLADHVGVIVTSVLLFYEDAEKLRS